MIETSRKKNKSKIKELILNNIYTNLKEYIIVTIILLIGIILGVIMINNTKEEQITEISIYINDFITSIKENNDINIFELLKTSFFENVKFVICMWLIGSTVIGVPIVLGIVVYRGFCIGYTLSAIITVLGLKKGIIFLLTTVFLQNIIYIPVIIFLAVSRNTII